MFNSAGYVLMSASQAGRRTNDSCQDGYSGRYLDDDFDHDNSSSLIQSSDSRDQAEQSCDPDYANYDAKDHHIPDHGHAHANAEDDSA